MSKKGLFSVVSALGIVTATVLSLSPAAVAAPAAPGGATAAALGRIGASCGEGFDPETTSNAQTGIQLPSPWHGIQAQVRYGNLPDGRQVGWARALNGPSTTRVWLDYSANGGRDWYQCGPTQRGTVGDTFTLATLTYPSSQYVMRACTDAPGTYSGNACTSWW